MITVEQALEIIYHIVERVENLSAEEQEALNVIHDYIVNHLGDDDWNNAWLSRHRTPMW